MKAYSFDLRQRIVEARQHGQTQEAVAARFSVSVRTVRRYENTLQHEGRLTPKKSPGAKPRLDETTWQELTHYIAQTQNGTLSDFQHFLAQRGVQLTTTALYANLRRRGFTHKKRVGWQPNETRQNEKSGVAGLLK